MKTFKILVSARTVRQGSDISATLKVEIDDDATPEEIQEEKENVAKEWVNEQIDWYWEDAQ
jgi:hypothetical protein